MELLWAGLAYLGGWGWYGAVSMVGGAADSLVLGVAECTSDAVGVV